MLLGKRSNENLKGKKKIGKWIKKSQKVENNKCKLTTLA